MATFPRRILVVDDEPDLADLFSLWLEREHEVETAYGGREAIDRLDDDVDLVLLDRRMPEISGDAVLDEIRARKLACEVVMITGIDFRVKTLGIDFDWYLAKPVARAELLEVVDFLKTKVTGDAVVQEYCDAVAKKVAVESHVPRETRRSSTRYQDIAESCESVAQQISVEIDVPGS